MGLEPAPPQLAGGPCGAGTVLASCADGCLLVVDTASGATDRLEQNFAPRGLPEAVRGTSSAAAASTRPLLCCAATADGKQVIAAGGNVVKPASGPVAGVGRGRGLLMDFNRFSGGRGRARSAIVRANEACQDPNCVDPSCSEDPRIRFSQRWAPLSIWS